MKRYLWLPLFLVADFSWAEKGDRTLTVGLAYTDFKESNDPFFVSGASERPLYGINLKHNYQFGDNLGAVFSVLYSKNDTSRRGESGRKYDFNNQYLSLSAGPSWRINPFFSVYGLVGASVMRSDAEFKTFNPRKVRKNRKRRIRGRARSTSSVNHVVEFATDYGLVAGAGMQFNLSQNLVLDTSWEYSWLRDNRISSWVVGVGYRF